jgi:hypothetical protein
MVICLTVSLDEVHKSVIPEVHLRSAPMVSWGSWLKRSTHFGINVLVSCYAPVAGSYTVPLSVLFRLNGGGKGRAVRCQMSDLRSHLISDL